MAVAVDFREFKPADSREDLIRRVEQAPVEHAEAILAVYDVLQKLHEKDVLNLASGLLSAGDTVVNHVVDLIASKEMVTALRVALIFSNLLSSIDPDQLHEVLTNSREEPPSLLSLGKQARSKYRPRPMGTALA